MSLKVLWVDIESTGLDPSFNEIIQLSGFLEIDEKRIEGFDIKMRPNHPERASEEALEKQNLSVEDIMKYPLSQKEGYDKFMKVLDKHIDRFDKTDKINIAGYNCGFDRKFIDAMFKTNNNDFVGAYFWFEMLDCLPLVMLFKIVGKYKGENLKLETVCEEFGLPFKVGTCHNSLYDIVQTRKLFSKLESKVTITD